MNAITQLRPTTPATPDAELIEVLESSFYPGAKRESIALVLGYCRAAGLDPMQRPVHIVPFWDKKRNDYRDVVMPGIGMYRTGAARTGQYAGIGEPEFGPEVSETIGGTKITYPQWCSVTVKRALPSGAIVEFSAREFWLECYAHKTGKERGPAPNAMWAKRPFGMLAKCAEAQALRKAFPELGSAPTADEMLDQAEDISAAPATTPAPAPRAIEALPIYPDDKFAENLPAWAGMIESGKKTTEQILATLATRYTLTEGQRGVIEQLESTMEVSSTNDE